MPKLIVATGYYNRTAKLQESVYSVLDQDFDDFRYHVFDDCSTDLTGRQLEKIEHPKYKFIPHSNNKGFVKGLIDVINDTDSEYIAIHGSGDFSLNERLKKQVEFLDSNPTFALIGSAYENCYGSNISIKRPDRDIYTNEDLKITNPFTHGEVMFRRKVYEQAGGYSEYFKFSQDYDLWLRMSKIAPLATISDVLYRRFIQMDGVSYSPDKLIRQKKFALLARALNEGNINRDDFPGLESFDVSNYISDRNSEIFKKKIFMTAVLVKHRQFSKAFDLLKKL